MTRTGEPSEITSNEPGSFAWRVLHDRHPAIIQRIGDDLPYPPHIRRSLDSLRAELDGSIRPLRANAPDGDAWYHWMRDHTGENWYDVPFLWSESFFYRKLLEAVGYFEPGPWNGIDPFAAQKSAELEAPQTEEDLEQLGRLACLPIADQISAALDAALWGNRADLGFLLSDPAAAYKERSRALVADDGKALRNLLAAAGLSRVSLVADNSGRELIADLVLIDLLLRGRLTRSVALHLKPYPYYVSDATAADLLACMRRLGATKGTRPIAERLFAAIADGRLGVVAHQFACAPYPYRDLPGDLGRSFARSSLVIFKGDLNYRRLVGDRRWPTDTPFSAAVAQFPARAAVLRILKSDVVVGVDPGRARTLADADPQWRTSGAHALVQLSE